MREIVISAFIMYMQQKHLHSLTIFCLNGLPVALIGVVLDVAVTSFSKWDPARFSIQWLELVNVSRVLLSYMKTGSKDDICGI